MQRRQLLRNLSLLGAGLTLSPLRAKPVTRTGLVYDPHFLEQFRDPAHPESARRLVTLHDYFQQRDLWSRTQSIAVRMVEQSALRAIHTEPHIAAIAKRYPVAHKVALLASGGMIAAVDAVMAGRIDNAFCASRPPGHHAINTGREEGFCYYNHIAISARHLQQKHGLERILIVDWDYHHGNGTEDAFYDDPSVLYFSTHDVHAYPATGLASRTGRGAGRGFNINVPLPCGTGDDDIVRAFEQHLLPAVVDFKPEFILISAGFDSRQSDLLGCFMVTDNGFRRLTRMMKALAATHCQGRLVSILEGGYNLKGNASAAVAHVEALLEA